MTQSTKRLVPKEKNEAEYLGDTGESARNRPWLLVWGAIVGLALGGALVWAGPEVVRQLGWATTPTKMAVYLIATTSTPSPTDEKPKPASPQEVPTTLAGESQTLDPCSPLILSPDEAQAILGEPVTPAQGVSGGCMFNNASDRLYTVSAAAAQQAQAANLMMAQAIVLNMAGVQFDAGQTNRLRELARPATTKEYFTELVTRAQGAPSVKARLLDGLGEGAYWAWLSGGSRPEGTLTAWSGGTLVNVNAIVASSRGEQDILNKSTDLALKMLRRLPPTFSIGQPLAAPLVSSATPPPSPTPTFSPSPVSTFVPTAPATKVASAVTPRPTAPLIAPGVYAIALRAVPPQPQNGQGVIFVVTILNTTGSPQYFNWCVESFREDGKSHGITACRPVRTVPAGRSDLSTTDPYIGQKVGGCLPLHARVIWQDSSKGRFPFKLPDGSDLWLQYQFCPA
jgi:hypothetical protein